MIRLLCLTASARAWTLPWSCVCSFHGPAPVNESMSNQLRIRPKKCETSRGPIEGTHPNWCRICHYMSLLRFREKTGFLLSTSRQYQRLIFGFPYSPPFSPFLGVSAFGRRTQCCFGTWGTCIQMLGSFQLLKLMSRVGFQRESVCFAFVFSGYLSKWKAGASRPGQLQRG